MTVHRPPGVDPSVGILNLTLVMEERDIGEMVLNFGLHSRNETFNPFVDRVGKKKVTSRVHT